MNEFDQFVKHVLKIKQYVRYTDDFIIVHREEKYLHKLIPRVQRFLQENLFLKLHLRKVAMRKLNQGIDFLGYVIFLHHRLVRTKTRKRIFKKLFWQVGEYENDRITRQTLEQSLQSYLGVFSHADAYRESARIRNQLWLLSCLRQAASKK